MTAVMRALHELLDAVRARHRRRIPFMSPPI
jgi:hypothetical protein